MKLKNVAAIAASMLLTLSANAGPFGVNPGDPIREDGVSGYGLIYEDLAPGNFGGFEYAKKYGTKETGTCSVVAFRDFWDTSGAGLEIQDFFHGVADRLTGKYGSPTTKKDALEAESLWDENSFWMHSLAIGERKLIYTWLNLVNEPRAIITLDTVGVNNNEAYVRIQYDFDNIGQCMEDVEQVF